MFGSLMRAMIVIILIVGALAFFAGYRLANGRIVQVGDEQPIGTAGRTDGAIDTSAARERGADAGEKIAEAGNRAADVVNDATLTAKIKSKMALDDSVKALEIDVTTRDGHVTLTGAVRSAAERDRALALARETAGVKGVTDRLDVRQ